MAKLIELKLSPVITNDGISKSKNAKKQVILCLDENGEKHFPPRMVAQLRGGIVLNGEEIVEVKEFTCKMLRAEKGDKFKASQDSETTNAEAAEALELTPEKYLAQRIKELQKAECKRNTPLPTEIDLATKEGKEALEEFMSLPIFEEGDEDVYHNERVIHYTV